MPFGSRLLLCLVPVALALVVACGGDDEADNGENTATPGRTQRPTATRETATPDGDDKPTPDGGDETPAGGASPTDGADSGPTPAPEGTPAVAPANQTAYVNQFQGRDVVEDECAYDPTKYLVTCPDRGDFAIDPPLQGQDVTCSIGIVDGTAEYIRCRSQEPLQAIYYEIQA
jgi:hypothetical protein